MKDQVAKGRFSRAVGGEAVAAVSVSGSFSLLNLSGPVLRTGALVIPVAG